MTHSPLALLALLAQLLLARPLAAQRIPAVAGAQLPPRGLIKVHTEQGARFYGRVISRTADSLVLTAPRPAERRAVAWAAVDTLWVQAGTLATPMAAGSALSFGAAFLGLAYFVLPVPEDDVGRVVAVGAGVGFLVGGAFGTLLPRWRPVFPAPSADAGPGRATGRRLTKRCC